MLRGGETGSTRLLSVIAVAVTGLALAACGGSGDSAAGAEPEAVVGGDPTLPTTSEETEESPMDDAAASPDPTGPAPAPGEGVLALADGRVYVVAIRECTFHQSGGFSVRGTSDGDAEFEMDQAYVGDRWLQSQVDLELPNDTSIYTIVSSSSDGASPATVDGKSITWTQTFRELDAAADRHVYTGEGVVRLTCP